MHIVGGSLILSVTFSLAIYKFHISKKEQMEMEIIRSRVKKELK